MVAFATLARHTRRTGSSARVRHAQLCSRPIAVPCCRGLHPGHSDRKRFRGQRVARRPEHSAEFVAFNRYDPRVNGLLAEQSCATPNEAQYVKALAAVPGEILTQATRCQTYQPWFAPAYGARPAQ